MRAVIYARTATREQDADDQVEMCKEFAKENGYELTDIFLDQGFSGSNMDRPSFQKMIQLLEKESDSKVIIMSSDRISRDQLQAAEFIEKYNVETVKNSTKV